MNILVDIGNTRLKWSHLQSGRTALHPVAALDYRQDDVCRVLRPVWSELPVARKLALAAVAQPSVASGVVELARGLWPDVEVVRPKPGTVAFGVTNAYRQPDRLGVDRWLALLAAHRFYPGESCIVDCGTAITVDVIDGEGCHGGGVIGPGLSLMKNALLAGAPGLAMSPAASVFGLADNTAAAVENGVLFAASGLIESVFNRLAKPHRLLLTGGDAAALAACIRLPYTIDAELVLKGLSLYCVPEGPA